MHGSIWRLTGEREDLLRGYESLIAATPAGNMRLHACLLDETGLLVVDTCPSQEVFAGFAAGFPAICAAHGLPVPELVTDLPVHAAFAGGERVV